MRIQEYHIHLVDGHEIITSEECSGPVEKHLFNRFRRCKSDDILVVGTPETRQAFIPARNILYISTGKSFKDDSDLN